MIAVFAVSLLAGCQVGAEATRQPSDATATRVLLPDDAGSWSPASTMQGDMPSGSGTIEIRDVGRYTFDAVDVQTLRPDIFAEGHFSLFDALAHLGDLGQIELEYHYDDGAETHVIDSLSGRPHWWYQAHYSSGWFETSSFRMDHYPWKDGTVLRVEQVTAEYADRLHRSFTDEVARRAANNGQVIVPEVVVRDPTGTRTFRDVAVTSHNVRSDVLQPGVVTALDILLSLGERGDLSLLELAWYETINRADPVDNYFVERIDDAEAYGRCGYVYEVGATQFSGFAGSHIHIATDVRVIVSPEYALWFWLCL